MLVGGACIKDGIVVWRGLDLLTVVGDEPLVVTVNGSQAAMVPGATSYSLSLGALAPWLRGGLELSVEPVQPHAWMLGGKAVAQAMEQLLQLYKVKISRAGTPKTVTTTETATKMETITTTMTETITRTETVTKTVVTTVKSVQAPWFLVLLVLVLLGDFLALLAINRLPKRKTQK